MIYPGHFYPHDFSPEAIAAIEAGLIKSWRQCIKRVKSGLHEETPSLRASILAVFSTYANECLKLGETGTFSIDDVGREALNGLRMMTLEGLLAMESHAIYTDFEYWLERGNGHVCPAPWREFMESREWKTYQNKLLRLAKVRTTPSAIHKTTVVAEAYTPESLSNAESAPKGSGNSTPPTGPPLPTPRSPGLTDGPSRRAAVDAYIEEVFKAKGTRITRATIWKMVGYSHRAEFERWERNAPQVNRSAHRRFAKLLSEKPHLK